MYTFASVNKSEIELFINGRKDSLLITQYEVMEDIILDTSNYFRIDEETSVGYFAIDDENILTQFYIVDLKHEDVLPLILKSYLIRQAYVLSYDPIFRAVSDKFKLASTVNVSLSKVLNEDILDKLHIESEHKILDIWF